MKFVGEVATTVAVVASAAAALAAAAIESSLLNGTPNDLNVDALPVSTEERG